MKHVRCSSRGSTETIRAVLFACGLAGMLWCNSIVHAQVQAPASVAQTVFDVTAQMVSEDDGRLEIQWYPSAGLQNFIIRYQNKTTGETQQVGVSGKTFVTLEGIDANSDYAITVIAVDQQQRALGNSAEETWLGSRSRQLREAEAQATHAASASAMPPPLNATLRALDSNNFPFIFTTVSVDTGGQPVGRLTTSDFTATEDGVLQTDFFHVTQPDQGGGVRLADFVFIIDNSGSMIEEQQAVKDNLIAFVDSLVARQINFRLGLVRFGQGLNNGAPIVMNSGNLTGDPAFFRTLLNQMTIDGGNEPGIQAVLQAAAGFSFRPGSQRHFLLITDEDSDGGSLSQAITVCRNNNITVHVAVNCGFDNSTFDYCNATSIRGATNGLLFSVVGPYNTILNLITSDIANTYIVRYRARNDQCDARQREVRITVNAFGQSDFVVGNYTCGAAPRIVRTPATIALSNSAQIAGTALTIAATITDAVPPLLQSATLFYRPTGAAAYIAVAMTHTGNNVYQAVIPGSAVAPPGMDYYITATDGQATSSDPTVDASTSPYQIAVLPNQPPQITHTPVTIGTPNTAIPINATVIDNTNRLVSVTLFYREFGTLLFTSVAMNLTGGNQYSATIPGSIVTNAGVEYYIRAVDDFNVASTHGVHRVTTGCTSNLFLDEFTDAIADGWLPNLASRWHVVQVDGNFAYCVDVANTSGDEYSILNQNKLGDFVLDVKARTLATSNRNFFILFGVQDFTNSAEDSYYLRFGGGNAGVTLFRSVAGVSLPLATAPDNFADDNRYHAIRIERRGSNIQVYGDQRLLINVNDNTHATGHIGFGSYQSTACFDNVQVSGCPDLLAGPVAFASYNIDDDNGGASNGDGDGRPESGERVEMTMALTNRGERFALDVSAILSTNDPDVTVFDDNNIWPNIAPLATAASFSNFGFQVNNTLQQDKDVTFNLTVFSSNGGPWTQTFPIRVYAVNTPAVVDLVADRVFLRTAPNSGVEVTNPVAGQQYYIHFDWRNAGALAANGFRLDFKLNGNVICTFNSASAPGNSIHNSYCTTPVVWPASGGVIQGALDVNNNITESTENNNAAFRTFGYQSFADFDFTAQVRSIENLNNNNGADFCFVYGYQDDRHYYYVMFNRALNETRVYKVRDNDRILIGDLGTFIIPNNNYHLVRLVRTGGNLQVFWDGVLLGSVANDAEYGAGGLGIGSFNDTGIFDDICVKPLGSATCIVSDNFEDGVANNWLPLNPSRWDVIVDGGDRGYRINDTNYENLEYLRLGEYSLIAPSGQADLVAQRIYLRTAQNSGSEVDAPAVGQSYYVHFDWRNAGALAANNVPVEIRLNGSVLCVASVTANPGESKTTVCNTPVVFNPGNYFFESTVDVGNLIAESNETNNNLNRTYVVSTTCAPTVCNGAALYPVPQGSVTIGDPIRGRTGSTICIDIRMKSNAQAINAFGFQVQVNPNHLDFVNAVAGDLTGGFTSVNANEVPAGSGRLIAGGFGATAIPANSNGVLIRLCFTVIGGIGASSDITLSNLADGVAGMNACCNNFSVTSCLHDGDVNNDRTLTPGDAFCAFNIYLSGGNVPTNCDAANFSCEADASDVNCDAATTPGDAFAIFTRYLQGLSPQDCFAKTALAKTNGNYQLALEQSHLVLSENANEEMLKLVVRVNDPSGLSAFGMQLAYPADHLEPLAVQRTALTAKWVKLEGQSVSSGQMRIGGFDSEALPSGKSAGLFEVLFKTKGRPVRLADFVLSDFTDGLSQATVQAHANDALANGATPRAFQLHQNFPNPFATKSAGNVTMIRFDLPGNEALKMELAIYNLAGQLVRQVLAGTRSPGAYEVAWDGNDESGRPVPSGTYLYRLRAGNHVASKSLVLVR